MRLEVCHLDQPKVFQSTFRWFFLCHLQEIRRERIMGVCRQLHKEPFQLRTATGLEEAENVCKVGVGHPKHEQLELPQFGQAALLANAGY